MDTFDSDTQDSKNQPQIEGPVSLLPDLGFYGIEEVDKGVCLDSVENRRLLKQHKMRWQPVFTAAGEPTDLIQAISEDMLLALQASSSRATLLLDPKDPNSDYYQGTQLLIEPDSDNSAPAWAIAATKHWLKVESVREDPKNPNPRFRPALAGPPGRCIARRVDGNRCRNWHNGQVADGEMCRVHLGKLVNRDQINAHEKARNRLRAAAAAAVTELEDLMYTATSEPVRLGAIKELMDRGGYRAGMDIEITHQNGSTAADEIRERLSRLAEEAVNRANLLKELEAAEELGEGDGGETNTIYIEPEEDKHQELAEVPVPAEPEPDLFTTEDGWSDMTPGEDEQDLEDTSEDLDDNFKNGYKK